MRNKVKLLILIIVDMVIVNLSFVLAFLIRFEGSIFERALSANYFDVYLENLLELTLIKLGIFFVFGLYKNLWKYASIEELVQVVTTTFVSSCAAMSYMLIMQQQLPRSIYILTFIFDVVLIGGARLSYRALKSIKDNGFVKRKNMKKVMIIGAGHAGAMIIKELKNHEELNSKPVAVIDEDRKSVV